MLENIAFYADVYCVLRAEQERRIDELLGFSGLLPFKTRLAGNLSGGMKQKLGLACALIHTPKVLLLDEPTNGVDPVSRRDFWQILYGLLKDRVSILYATSYLDEAERCRRVGLIHKEAAQVRLPRRDQGRGGGEDARGGVREDHRGAGVGGSAAMNDASIAVEVRDLEKRFGAFTAVNRVSFAVRRGEIFGFLGPNGAGKSTTIRMLCGILPPPPGTARSADSTSPGSSAASSSTSATCRRSFRSTTT